ncbi:F0F1 ATP synthase subunit B [Mycoplasmopsis synoviae]|uniref:ATP synthase subunit b n=1 Tax=Mycoplasmopsis synoviae (strain 53) TaxID=262723 RepID=ATPF_MYCS5|nr:F0F1 ATP synthase subunit B [Mycoplasmopsis synoviae]Q4A600.2 RecName: Full=ATP synthase subunit b; AltName: Full=ATP synthase F(0) sector subunit b; AltName: Full=ATPase subunit I; AltName: Full=F-type ATPase subunit b; Short=F-ATPase subunit b [Mycoplasmopsis synoviae 53]AAZ43821.2 ATP synthase B chain [Mycoplasmopsis synoviae 53]UBX97378.1 F0F1 ATP synthase subunit B [Mycoplasmopsis synoviae]UBX98066.1 F0F1 ATP synthase subunit B [Mycoplasmopsis synoviae]UBX99002.1 F0F1 ATP synthase subu
MSSSVQVLSETIEIGKVVTASDEIAKRFNNLFPSIPMMLATFIAFVIVFLLLFFFLYNPVKKMIRKRQEFIQSQIDDSIKAKEDSLAKLSQAQAELIESHKQSVNIVNNAKSKAQEILASYKNKAISDANRLIEETQIDLNERKKEFDKNSRILIAETATEIAQRILKREISKSTQDEIIKDFLEDKTPIEDI